MVLIPNDVGVRMRTQTETIVQPIAPVGEIPADLLELRPGQTFSARIQEVLPENTYKALVAGRSLTLALPEGAKTGDTLELVVVDRTPRLIVAQLANRNASGDAATGAADQFTTLSRTAQLIGSLLTRDGASVTPAALTRGPPLLAEASTNTAKLAAELAPQLARAVSQSGLFYEAHQVQWLTGQRPLSDLLAEPQARHALTPPLAEAEMANPATRSLPSANGGEVPRPVSLLQGLFGTEETRPQNSAPAASPASPTQAVPEELRPLVQQQLDAAATQRLAWHGEVWPGQALDWQIEPDDRHSGDHQTRTERNWLTSLRLSTPRLGEIDARLNLTPQGVSITLSTPVGASAADMLDSAPTLERSMAAAGVPLLALQVQHDNRE